MMLDKACILLLFVFSSMNLMGQSQMMDSELTALLERASNENKKLLVYYTAEWCTPCKVMEKTVLQEQDVKSFIDRHFVWKKVNIDSAEATEFLKEFKWGSIPQYNVIDKNKQRIFFFNGSMGKEKFLARLEESLNPQKGKMAISTMQYDKGERSIEFLLRHIAVLEEYQSPDVRKVYIELFSNGKTEELDSVSVITYMEKYLLTEGSPDYTYLLKNRDDLTSKYGAVRVDGLIARPTLLKLEESAINGNSEEFASLLHKVRQNGWADDKDLYYMVRTYLTASKQFDKFIELVEGDEYPQAFSSEEERLFDGLSYIILSKLIDNEKIMQKASKWNEKISEDKVDRLLIKGQVDESLGNNKQALAKYELALKLFGQENPEFPVAPTGITTLIDNVKKKL